MCMSGRFVNIEMGARREKENKQSQMECEPDYIHIESGI